MGYVYKRLKSYWERAQECLQKRLCPAYGIANLLLVRWLIWAFHLISKWPRPTIMVLTTEQRNGILLRADYILLERIRFVVSLLDIICLLSSDIQSSSSSMSRYHALSAMNFGKLLPYFLSCEHPNCTIAPSPNPTDTSAQWRPWLSFTPRASQHHGVPQGHTIPADCGANGSK